MASEVDVEALARELNRWPWCDAMCASGDVACGVCQQQHTMLALLARLHAAEAERDRYLAVMTQQSKALTRAEQAEQERDEARAALALEERLKLEACNQAETEAARAEAAEARWHAEHATALEALRQAEAAEARVAGRKVVQHE